MKECVRISGGMTPIVTDYKLLDGGKRALCLTENNIVLLAEVRYWIWRSVEETEKYFKSFSEALWAFNTLKETFGE